MRYKYKIDDRVKLVKWTGVSEIPSYLKLNGVYRVACVGKGRNPMVEVKVFDEKDPTRTKFLLYQEEIVPYKKVGIL